jgi:hypothetical protein
MARKGYVPIWYGVPVVIGGYEGRQLQVAKRSVQVA